MLPGFFYISRDQQARVDEVFELLARSSTCAALLPGVMEMAPALRNFEEKFDFNKIREWASSLPESKLLRMNMTLTGANFKGIRRLSFSGRTKILVPEKEALILSTTADVYVRILSVDILALFPGIHGAKEAIQQRCQSSRWSTVPLFSGKQSLQLSFRK